ncbi:solute carrier family 12 member 1-like [Culex quinquefasciatus]|uniref:solute carrier family 12 member 1-like n=1 Tax=Culex quinquefasciatus TaxID=7176 RepID=UPI0018E33073|nr:solute carrier family 12 member 1-like [Culex quinquefasciatus]
MAIGILAGDITSGDLKNASKAIPGAISVIILTSISSVGTPIVADITVVIDATGNVSDLANGSWIYADCAPEKYEYGLHNSFQVMELVSGPIIYAEYAEKHLRGQQNRQTLTTYHTHHTVQSSVYFRQEAPHYKVVYSGIVSKKLKKYK